jgi:translation elongation factor EF-Ts
MTPTQLAGVLLAVVAFGLTVSAMVLRFFIADLKTIRDTVSEGTNRWNEASILVTKLDKDLAMHMANIEPRVVRMEGWDFHKLSNEVGVIMGRTEMMKGMPEKLDRIIAALEGVERRQQRRPETT